MIDFTPDMTATAMATKTSHKLKKGIHPLLNHFVFVTSRLNCFNQPYPNYPAAELVGTTLQFTTRLFKSRFIPKVRLKVNQGLCFLILVNVTFPLLKLI